MLLWATAAFMKRKSRMAQLSAAVPTAAQAAWRMNSRRVRRPENCWCRISLSLYGEIGRVNEQVNDGLHTIAHISRRRNGEVDGISNVVDDRGSGTAG